MNQHCLVRSDNISFKCAGYFGTGTTVSVGDLLSITSAFALPAHRSECANAAAAGGPLSGKNVAGELPVFGAVCSGSIARDLVALAAATSALPSLKFPSAL